MRLGSPRPLPLLLPLLLLLLTGASAVTVKRWRHDTNWSSAHNWSRGRAPTDADSVAFPGPGPLAVSLPDGSTRVWELSLPADGALLLPPTGSLKAFGSGSRAGLDRLPITRNEFLRRGPLAWLDPDNWQAAEEGGAAAAADAVPHLERVPCRHDTVQLPAGSSFALRLPELPVTVAGVRFGDRVVSPDSWQQAVEAGQRAGDWAFLQTAQRSGAARPAVTIRSQQCADPTGCACELAPGPAEYAEYAAAVCKYARRRCSAAAPPCLAPVRPLGSCCPLCGAYLLLEYEPASFSLARLRRTLARYKPDQVQAHASKAAAGRVQVVLLERGHYTGDSARLAADLRAQLLDSPSLGVRSVSVAAAGPPADIAGWGSVAGPAFGSLLAALALFAGIFLAWGSGRRFWPQGVVEGGSFVFARFENTDTEGETVEVMAASQDPPENQAFDNPMYGQRGSDDQEASASYSDLKKKEEEKPDAEESEMTEITEIVEMNMVDVDIDDGTEA